MVVMPEATANKGERDMVIMVVVPEATGSGEATGGEGERNMVVVLEAIGSGGERNRVGAKASPTNATIY